MLFYVTLLRYHSELPETTEVAAQMCYEKIAVLKNFGRVTGKNPDRVTFWIKCSLYISNQPSAVFTSNSQVSTLSWLVTIKNFIWDTSTFGQVSKCDVVMLEFFIDRKFHFPQGDLNCKPLWYNAVI